MRDPWPDIASRIMYSEDFMAPDRPIPADLAAERSVLGAILLERDAILAIGDQIQPADFSLEKHSLVYAAMQACLARREPPT
jgi:replicative DNA helicase